MHILSLPLKVIREPEHHTRSTIIKYFLSFHVQFNLRFLRKQEIVLELKKTTVGCGEKIIG